MVDRPRLQNSIIYGGIAAFGLAVLVPDPTGTTFVFLFPILTLVGTIVLYWTGWFVTE
ncbi:hypothetical protein halTADL_2792 [Halohasta litchfieldiae]|jgi:threonine/homoserine/homoserine lactone efflux protein|uniref:Uncharacterized protein n=1 Tax=Halohasta litchfieldiae TaxID=1073996 RepID=A0A1H6W2D4_9EURY|nr:hypothetical protein [Halohasta litchfieldiae]ATW89506.1 hypothetical protein halTADL_2792 [Halohasta litchfieldiae]SEJ11098.1 hypothetical protein SAMN05444271_1224 [Halohasta litchfieldiae]